MMAATHKDQQRSHDIKPARNWTESLTSLAKGVFNVRTGPELHRAAVLASGEKSLNVFVCDAIREKVERKQAV